MILAGDIGGTKTVLALFDGRAGPLMPVREATLASRQYARFEDVLQTFLGDRAPGAIAAACFGVAGPVVDGRVVTTNLPWQLDEAALLLTIPTTRVRLLNDLEATAHGVLGLGPESLYTLQPGRSRTGNIAVIAAGTGLGEALLVWDGSHHLVTASEGGHADFGPRSEIEVDLLQFLRKDHVHVSYERVVSGPGLRDIYRFVRATSGLTEPAWLTERMATGDPSAAIAAAGLGSEDVNAMRALEIWRLRGRWHRAEDPPPARRRSLRGVVPQQGPHGRVAGRHSNPGRPGVTDGFAGRSPGGARFDEEVAAAE